MGLTEYALRKWVKQARLDTGTVSPGRLITQERAKLTALHKELKRVQMERDVFKKATTFLARESQDHSPGTLWYFFLIH